MMFVVAIANRSRRQHVHAVEPHRARKAEMGLRRGQRQTGAASREPLHVGEQLVDRDPEAERGDGQIGPLEPERRKSHHHARERRRQARADQGQQPGSAREQEMREGVRADGEKARLSEGDLPGVADDQVLPQDPDGHDGDQGPAHDPRRLAEERHRDRQRQGRRNQRAHHAPAGEAQLLAVALDQIHSYSV